MLLCATALAQETSQSITRERLQTVAGELKVIQLDKGELGSRFIVTLDGKTIVKTDGDDELNPLHIFPVPTILKRYALVRPYDEVVIFQQNMWGNACNGGPLWFLGLKRDGSFAISSNVEHCGGPDPIIRRQRYQIIVSIPAHSPNRGQGYIPKETWLYKNGQVTQVK